MEQPWYKEWFNSPYYHKLYFSRNEEEAENFIHRLIQQLCPPHHSRMLDVACGKGRHSRVLAALGFEVTGIDLAPDNIAAAQQSETEKLHFFLHDMRRPFWINYFDYAFNFFTSFGYFRTRREHDDAVRSIAASLKPGGVFVLDYLNPRYAENHLVHDEVRKIDGTSFEIHRWDDETHFYKKITITDRDLAAPLTFTEKIAKLTLGDFADMFSFQSLQVEQVYGDYQLNPYHLQTAPRLILCARKAGRPEEGGGKRLFSDGRATDALT